MIPELGLVGVVMVPEPLILDHVPKAGAVAASVVEVTPHNAWSGPGPALQLVSVVKLPASK